MKHAITAANGFLAAGVHCHIKKDHDDFAMIYSVVPAVAAAVYTNNRFQAAPLQITRENLAKEQRAQVVIINSGVANAAMGELGREQARSMSNLAATTCGVEPHAVIVASTGVIGMPLPMDKIQSGTISAHAALSKDGGDAAARAIMTTDTKMKTALYTYDDDGVTITIGGMAKGAGMIHPNMSTMLGFVTTDAAIDSELLQQALQQAVNRSFNMITVDGDTSTNDMVAVLANGAAGALTIRETDARYDAFVKGLQSVCTDLAKQIAADGEGASKSIEVRIHGAISQKDADLAARAVAGSSLVKAAVFGRDANWGRIACAVGYSGAMFDAEQVTIYLGDILVAKHGQGVTFDEEKALAYLSGDAIVIDVDLHNGVEEAVAWGCDLTPEYVNFNAAYRS